MTTASELLAQRPTGPPQPFQLAPRSCAMLNDNSPPETPLAMMPLPVVPGGAVAWPPMLNTVLPEYLTLLMFLRQPKPPMPWSSGEVIPAVPGSVLLSTLIFRTGPELP